jgi:hypothetical protein
MSSEWSLPFRFHISSLPSVLHSPPISSSLTWYPNNIWWSEQVMKLLIMQFSPSLVVNEFEMMHSGVHRKQKWWQWLISDSLCFFVTYIHKYIHTHTHTERPWTLHIALLTSYCDHRGASSLDLKFSVIYVLFLCVTDMCSPFLYIEPASDLLLCLQLYLKRIHKVSRPHAKLPVSMPVKDSSRCFLGYNTV